MTDRSEDRDGLAPGDRDLVRRVAELYRSPAMSPARRAAFDARLRERIARPAGGRLRAALAAAACVAVLAALVWSVARTPEETAEARDPGAAGETVAAAPAASPEELLLDLVSEEPPPAAGEVAHEALPDEYVAIAGLFLEER